MGGDSSPQRDCHQFVADEHMALCLVKRKQNEAYNR